MPFLSDDYYSPQYTMNFRPCRISVVGINHNGNYLNRELMVPSFENLRKIIEDLRRYSFSPTIRYHSPDFVTLVDAQFYNNEGKEVYHWISKRPGRLICRIPTNSSRLIQFRQLRPELKQQFFYPLYRPQTRWMTENPYLLFRSL